MKKNKKNVCYALTVKEEKTNLANPKASQKASKKGRLKSKGQLCVMTINSSVIQLKLSDGN